MSQYAQETFAFSTFCGAVAQSGTQASFVPGEGALGVSTLTVCLGRKSIVHPLPVFAAGAGRAAAQVDGNDASDPQRTSEYMMCFAVVRRIRAALA